MHNENVKKALEILKKAVQNREAVVVEGFVQLGPDELRKALEIEDGERWQEAFDYMVLNQGVMKHCVRKYMDFFHGFMVDRGPLAIRTAFNIEDAKYDSVFEEIFDLVAIGKGALYDHVQKNMHVYVMTVRDGKADNLRVELGLGAKRYQKVWEELLGQFMNAVCDDLYDQRQVEQGIFLFDALMNSLREHRSLRSNEKMWAFEEAIS